jgi:hypothetical protein
VDGLTTDRNSVLVLFDCRQTSSHIEPADSGQVDDGQTNSVLIDLSVWPSNVVRVDDGQTNSVCVCNLTSR